MHDVDRAGEQCQDRKMLPQCALSDNYEKN